MNCGIYTSCYNHEKLNDAKLCIRLSVNGKIIERQEIKVDEIVNGKIIKVTGNTNFAFNPNDKTATRKKK